MKLDIYIYILQLDEVRYIYIYILQLDEVRIYIYITVR